MRLRGRVPVPLSLPSLLCVLSCAPARSGALSSTAASAQRTLPQHQCGATPAPQLQHPRRQYHANAMAFTPPPLPASLTLDTVVPEPPARPDDSHKGTYGTVVVVGGCPSMIGAPAITATSALRTGAGLVKVMAEESIVQTLLLLQPSATTLPMATPGAPRSAKESHPRPLEILARTDARKTNVLAVGPGFGTGEGREKIVSELVFLGDRRAVLDADALNLLAGLGQPAATRLAASKQAPTLVLTPHPGEFLRLAKPLGITESATKAEERPAAAQRLALAYNAVVVLKGRHTVVTDGKRVYFNLSGNPALSTAGSGDVLTGVVASLMAQGLAPYEAAKLGVHVHGLAADLWAEKHGRAGLLALELCTELLAAFQSLRAGGAAGAAACPDQ